MTREQELVGLIGKYDESYWERSQSEISDVEYDKLVEELRSINPKNPILERIGNDKTPGIKVKHVEHMFSLAKTYTWDDLYKWAASVARSPDELFCFSMKMDGISLEIANGRLITRGDGDVGTDITHLAPWILARFSYSKETVECSMHTIIEDQRFTLENKKQPKRYVGELLIPTDRFKKLKNSYPNIFGEMKNPRNTAAGFSMWKPDCDSLKELVYAGLPVPICTWVNHRAHELTYPLKEIRERGDEIITKLRSYQKLPCDGIVCRLKDEEYGVTLGVTQHHPKSAIAYKFKDEAYTSIVRDIEWSLGNEAVTPVAIFDPILIDSDEIQRATCHNARFVLDNNIVPGCEITIERRGNVIPKVVKVVQKNNLKAKVPDRCPDCGQSLVYSETDALCVNQQCLGRITNKIFNGLHTLGMNGIGPALIRRMCGCLYIPGIIEWCLESWDQEILIKKGFTAREIRLIKSEFERVSNAGVTDEAVFASLCIPQAGESFAKKVINYTGSIMTLLEPPETLKAKLKGCPGLNSTALQNVIDFMIEQDGASAFESYYNLFTHLRPIDADTRVKYCFTGALPHPRKELEEWVLDHGAYPTDRIAQANYLVSASPTSTSEKMKYAREHNIPVITFDQMMNQLSKGV